MLMVFQLTGGDFDVKRPSKHANADAELSQNFKQLNASTDDFQGFPSSMIEGTYDLNGKRMHSYNRDRHRHREAAGHTSVISSSSP